MSVKHTDKAGQQRRSTLPELPASPYRTTHLTVTALALHLTPSVQPNPARWRYAHRPANDDGAARQAPPGLACQLARDSSTVHTSADPPHTTRTSPVTSAGHSNSISFPVPSSLPTVSRRTRARNSVSRAPKRLPAASPAPGQQQQQQAAPRTRDAGRPPRRARGACVACASPREP